MKKIITLISILLLISLSACADGSSNTLGPNNGGNNTEENEENVGLAKVKKSKLISQANQNMSQNDEENGQDNLTDNDNDNENEEENEVLSPVYVSDNQNADAAYLQQMQTQTQTNIVQNGGGQYIMDGYANNGIMAGTETTTNEMINNYSLDNLDLSSHLTGITTNQKKKTFKKNNNYFSEDGNDWSLFVFKNYYERQGKNYTLLWTKIKDIVIKLMILF